jgi:hypothetical protein
MRNVRVPIAPAVVLLTCIGYKVCTAGNRAYICAIFGFRMIPRFFIIDDACYPVF